MKAGEGDGELIKFYILQHIKRGNDRINDVLTWGELVDVGMRRVPSVQSTATTWASFNLSTSSAGLFESCNKAKRETHHCVTTMQYCGAII